MTLIEPKFGPWGPDPTPKVGSIWGLFLRFHLDPEIGPIFWSYQPIFGPQGLTLIRFGPQNWVRVSPQGQKLGWYNQKI